MDKSKSPIDEVAGLLESIESEARDEKVHAILHTNKIEVVRGVHLLEVVEVKEGEDLVEVVDQIKNQYNK